MPVRPGFGPLRGVRIVEIASIGPGPFAAMMLADHGAEVIRVERPGEPPLALGPHNPLHRGRPAIRVDLKAAEGVALVLRLAEAADALIEGFRPGVMERLGLGPDELLARNPRLVYGRMTGYGQDGPLAGVAGHDINYLSIAGALGAFRRRGERPLAPLNLLADFGGGGMLLAFGVLAAVLEARASGSGQVVDAAMVDGTAALTALFHGLRAAGLWDDEPGTNWLDSGAHFYEVYATADGGHVAVGALEPQFYAELLRRLELDPADFPQWERERWPELKRRLADLFATRTRAEWAELLEGAEACATPVLALHEAPEHPHNIARSTFVVGDAGVVQPAPAPRFSRTPGAIAPAARVDETLRAWGVGADEVARLRQAGALD